MSDSLARAGKALCNEKRRHIRSKAKSVPRNIVFGACCNYACLVSCCPVAGAQQPTHPYSKGGKEMLHSTSLPCTEALQEKHIWSKKGAGTLQVPNLYLFITVILSAPELTDTFWTHPQALKSPLRTPPPLNFPQILREFPRIPQTPLKCLSDPPKTPPPPPHPPPPPPPHTAPRCPHRRPVPARSSCQPSC